IRTDAALSKASIGREKIRTQGIWTRENLLSGSLRAKKFPEHEPVVVAAEGDHQQPLTRIALIDERQVLEVVASRGRDLRDDGKQAGRLSHAHVFDQKPDR